MKTCSMEIDVSPLQRQQDIDLQDSFLNLEVLWTALRNSSIALHGTKGYTFHPLDLCLHFFSP